MFLNELQPDRYFDVCVVGGGFAGLCAALSAAESGASVILLEASRELGGSLLRGQGILNAHDPRRQNAMGVSDTPEKHLQDMLKFGNLQNQPDLANRVCYEAAGAVAWLEAHGVRFDRRLCVGFGTTLPRGHVPADGLGGASYRSALEASLRSSRAEVLLQAEVTDWEKTESGEHALFNIFVKTRANAASGGRSDPKSAPSDVIRIRCGALVLCAGNGTSNRARLTANVPYLADAPILNTSSDGRILYLAVNKGAQTLGESFVTTVLCSVDQDGRLNRAENLPAVFRNPARFLLLDEKGRRFLREDAPTETLLLEIGRRSKERIFLLTTASKSEVESCSAVCFESSLVRLEGRLHLPARTLTKAVETYEAGIVSKVDPWGRAPGILHPFHGADRSPQQGWALVQVCAAAVVSSGGLRTDADLRVVRRDGRSERGLYAAGDLVGGVHGTRAIRGNLLASAAVFGIAAGRAAAAEAVA